MRCPLLKALGRGEERRGSLGWMLPSPLFLGGPLHGGWLSSHWEGPEEENTCSYKQDVASQVLPTHESELLKKAQHC